MADGDEKIDHNDRVWVLNRVTSCGGACKDPDGPTCRCAVTETHFDGRALIWEPGQVRSIQRLEAQHHTSKSTVLWDPSEQSFPIQRLVIVDEQRNPVEHGASATPLTEDECKRLKRFGVVDPTNLPPDRSFAVGKGGAPAFFQDPTTGETGVPVERVAKTEGVRPLEKPPLNVQPIGDVMRELRGADA